MAEQQQQQQQQPAPPQQQAPPPQQQQQQQQQPAGPPPHQAPPPMPGGMAPQGPPGQMPAGFAGYPPHMYGGGGYGPPVAQYPPPYMMYPGYPAPVMYQNPAGPPPMQQQAPPPQQQAPPQQHQQQSQQQQSKQEGQDDSGEQSEAAGGAMSWAQIARDPTTPAGGDVGGDGTPQALEASPGSFGATGPPGNARGGVQGEARSAGSAARNWSVEVKSSARKFTEAQAIARDAAQYGLPPLPFFLSRLSPDQQFAIMNGQRLPPGNEYAEQIVQYLHTITAFAFLGFINPSGPQTPFLAHREYFVVECVDEMEVFKYIKNSVWTISDDDVATMVSTVHGRVSGIGNVILLFTIPSLRKMVGLAEVMSPVLTTEGGEKLVQLRWLFIRDIPVYHLRNHGALGNPALSRVASEEADTTSAGLEDGSDTPAVDQEAENTAAEAEAGVSEGKQATKDEAAAGATSTAADAAGDGKGQDDGGDGGDAKDDEDAKEEAAAEDKAVPKVFAVTKEAGDHALATIARFKSNGGILLDFQEYFAAEQERRAPNPANLVCGGPRHRPSPPGSGRGRGRGGSGRFSTRGRGGRGGSSYNSSGPAGVDGGSSRDSSGGKPRGRGRGRGRGGSSRGMSDENRTHSSGGGRGGRDSSGRGGRSRVSRKVEGSDGARTLNSSYEFQIQRRKGKGSVTSKKSEGENGADKDDSTEASS